MANNIQSLQQFFGENCGFQKTVIWDHVPATSEHILKKKIEELIRDQGKKYETKVMEIRQTLFEAIWAQRKYTNKHSMTAIIYVFVTQEKNVRLSKSYTCHPVIRTQKCINSGDSSNCCMIFVDEWGRVYQNWKAFKEENILPAGFMCAPKNGIYVSDGNNCVELEVCSTPAASGTETLKSIGDTSSMVAGIGSAAICIAGAFTSVVAAPVVAAAGVVGIGAGLYSSARSGYHLYDRNAHEQPVNLLHPQARNSWLSLLAGTVTVGASGATKAMTTAAATGREISAISQIVINGMNISSIVLSGAGLSSGALDLIMKYQNDEKITLLDYLQLSTSLVLFTHSVYNFRLASSIINETRNGTFQTYRDSLSRRQRQMFDKMSKETIRIQGAERGKIDIIRSINEMPSKQYLNDLHKINKALNKKNVRPSFNGEGSQVLLNNEVLVDTSTLRGSVQHNVGPDILNEVPQTLPTSHNENMINGNTPKPVLLNNMYPSSNTNVNNNGIDKVGNMVLHLVNGSFIHLSKYTSDILQNIGDYECLKTILEKYSVFFFEESFDYIMTMFSKFAQLYLKEIQQSLKSFISAESVLNQIFIYILENLNDYGLENLIKQTDTIFAAVKSYFLSWKTFDPLNGSIKCTICSGYYSICKV